MRIESQRDGDRLRLVFTGADSLDANVTGMIRDEALALTRDVRELTVDLGNIEFIDSSGVGVMVSLFRSCRGKGRRCLFVGVAPQVRRILEIIRLDEIFELEERLPAASTPVIDSATFLAAATRATPSE